MPQKILRGLPALLLICVLPAPAADVVEIAGTLGGAKTFAAAAKSSGLEETLKQGGPYTVFAPDDAAFAKLPPSERDELMKDKSKLAQVLAYHIIPGKVMVADVKPGLVKSVEGGELKITSDNGKVTVNEANVTQSDMAADNGVVHVIDSVVLPKD